MISTRALTLGLLAMFSCSSLQAQEATAGSPDVANEGMNFSMMADAKFAALTSILSKLTVCNAKRKFYSPGAVEPPADVDGCASLNVISGTSPQQPPYQVLNTPMNKTLTSGDYERPSEDGLYRAVKLVKLPTGYFNYSSCRSTDSMACTVFGSATGGWNVMDKSSFKRCVVQCR